MSWLDFIAPDRQWLSDVAGSASFFVWLFAQSPQLYENYRNSSCEGLSFVFLLQWMAGDVTNLIGCILTQQLPFQIAVATYFCSIDTCILAQYYYYWRRDSRLAQEAGHDRPTRRHARYSSVTAPNMRSSSTQASFRYDNERTSPSTSVFRGSSRVSRPAMMHSHDSSSSFRPLTQSTRSVADLANEYAQRAARRDAARQERRNRKAREAHEKERKTKSSDQGVLSSGDDEDAPEQLRNSIMSDSSQGSEGFGYGFGSASTMLEPIPNKRSIMPPSSTSNIRGRDMTRTAGKIEALSMSRSPRAEVVTSEMPQGHGSGLPVSTVAAESRQSNSNSVPPRRSRGSNSTTRRSTRGAGIVLLGVTALFGFTSRTPTDVARSIVPSHSSGRALSIPAWDASPIETQDRSDRSTMSLIYTISTTNQHHHLPPPAPTWDRIVGRISAWVCTVLYMTSRLPQIWTNLSRKSVQGLSILLFMAAAMGNALYSISILVNPLSSGPHRYAYISESLPFLLGSGGTLIFDAIIVMQWIAWRGMEPIIEPSHHRTTTSTIYYRSSSLTGQNQTASRHRRFTSLERQPLLD